MDGTARRHEEQAVTSCPASTTPRPLAAVVRTIGGSTPGSHTCTATSLRMDRVRRLATQRSATFGSAPGSTAAAPTTGWAGYRPSGSTVYIAGAGPVGRCGAAAARLLGASCIIVGHYHQDRLDLVKSNGCETIDLSQDIPLTDQIEAILGEPMVDCAVDYVGTEAHGIGADAQSMDPANAINQVLDATRAGGATGVIGVYGPDPLAASKDEQQGTYPIDFGKAWIKSPRVTAGQAPIMHYNRELMMAILWDRMPYLSAMLNTQVISLDEAPAAYETFDQGSPNKFIIDPHGMLSA